MGYSPKQKAVAKAIARQGRKHGANRTQLLAAYDAWLTENPQLVSGGDRDSEGPFQQRPSQGWGTSAQVNDPDYAAAAFFKSAKGVGGKLHPGQLAQAVQRSAFPGRYAQHTKEAAALIAQFAGGKAAPSPSGSKTKTVTVKPAVDNSGARSALLTQYLSSRSSDASKDSGNLLNLGLSLKDAQDTPAQTKTVKVKTPASKGPVDTSAKGTVNFGGKPVAAWMVPILKYARSKGWKGGINSGYRSYAKQKQIYDSGVRPAAVPGTSRHEGSKYPLGAIDVSDAATLNRIINSSNSPYKGKLTWAGSKDPVHFSHPTGGGY